MRLAVIYVITVSFFIVFPSSVFADLSVDMETGYVFPYYNNVRIPGDTGTKFSLTDDLDSDITSYIRGRITYSFLKEHSVAFTVAPLRIDADGSVDEDVIFDDVVFPAETRLDADYRFDSYRLTYRYDFYHTSVLKTGLGLTLFLRDAEIRLEGGGLDADKSDVGLVPLVNFRVEWVPKGRYFVTVQGDVLASSQGRAEDVLLVFGYRAGESLSFSLGYRIIEGGVDNDDVYNFSLFNLLAAGVTCTF